VEKIWKGLLLARQMGKQLAELDKQKEQ